MQSTWFREFVTEPLGAVQDCFRERVEFESEVVLLGDPSIELQSGKVGEGKRLFQREE